VHVILWPSTWLESATFWAVQVYKALLDGVQEVAVKVFHDVHTVVQEADILREVAILKGCRDRNIVQFYGACRDVSPYPKPCPVSARTGSQDGHFDGSETSLAISTLQYSTGYINRIPGMNYHPGGQ
jgi:hypothetical protein